MAALDIRDGRLLEDWDATAEMWALAAVTDFEDKDLYCTIGRVRWVEYASECNDPSAQACDDASDERERSAVGGDCWTSGERSQSGYGKDSLTARTMELIVKGKLPNKLRGGKKMSEYFAWPG